MKNNNFFSFSWPLIRESFKMYWYIPALSFVMYFFVGMFPVLSNWKRLPDFEYYISQLFDNMTWAYVLLLATVPVVAGAMVMGYMHRGPKTMMLHALPISKSRMFNSYYLSGWILCQIPILLMSILYCAIAPKVDIIQLSDVLRWFISSVSIITFFYSISVLAGTLTGTVYMNLIATGIMLVIAPLIMLITKMYCEMFIPGFYIMPDVIQYFTVKTNPLFALLFYYEPLSVKAYIIYFIIGVVIAGVAKAIYKTRKLELVGNSMLSKVFEEICTYLIVFVGMTAFGLLTWNFTSQRTLVIVGMIVGIIVTFVISKIVVNRSIKIFDKRFIRSIIIYLCISVVFISVIIFDMFGIGQKMPERSEIESVEMTDIVDGYEYSSRAYGDADENYADFAQVLTSDEAIELVLKLHEYIIDEEIYILNDGSYEDDDNVTLADVWGNETFSCNEYINITYNLKGGKQLTRRYDIILGDEVAEIIDELLTCDEYKEKSKITSYINIDKIQYMTIARIITSHSENNGGEERPETLIVEDKDKIMGILESWNQDVISGGYKKNNRSISDSYAVASIEVYFAKEQKKPSKNKHDKETVVYSGSENPFVGFSATDMDKNLLNYLKQIGYGDELGI